jgi:CheY-like chemotaxis protein
MFLVSSRNSDFQTLHEVDSSTYLISKPVTNSALFDGIIKLALKTDFAQELVVKPARSRNPTILINDINLKILVAEDNLINQKLIRALLERRGHQVAIVNNGLQVIEYLEQEIFDLILMDIQMPSMSGDIATAKIRSANKSYSNIPIIALTAHAMLGDRERYLELGMNDYVTKPIDRNELYRCISEQFKT